MRTSWDVLHEDLEDTVLCSGAMVLDNVLVLQVVMKLNLLLQGLVLSGEEKESTEERGRRRGMLCHLPSSFKPHYTPRGKLKAPHDDYYCLGQTK